LHPLQVVLLVVVSITPQVRTHITLVALGEGSDEVTLPARAVVVDALEANER